MFKLYMIKYACFFLIIFLAGCSFNANIQGKGAAFLQGEWKQKEDLFKDKLVEYKTRKFQFKCDSFYLVINNHSAINISLDSCYGKGEWQEFVKGTYSFNQDTIFFKGAYVSHLFKLKTSKCYNSGGFEETIIIKSKTDKKLILDSFTNGKMEFYQTKKGFCNPKKIN